MTGETNERIDILFAFSREKVKKNIDNPSNKSILSSLTIL